MVVIRCLEHPPDERLYDWAAVADPVGFPDTAVMCAQRTHGEAVPGRAFLSADEYRQYRRGRRVFSLSNAATQIRVSETAYERDAVLLYRPPEPSEDALGVDVQMPADTQQLVRAVQSYLWSDHWGDALTARGTTWQAFVAETADRRSIIREWAAGTHTWDDVLDTLADALAVTLHDSSPPSRDVTG